MQNIGHRIADMRETKGITQADLAKKLKTTQSAIARIESGNQNVSADMLKRIGQALGKNLITLSPGTVNIQIEGGKKLARVIGIETDERSYARMVWDVATHNNLIAQMLSLRRSCVYTVMQNRFNGKFLVVV